MPAACPLRITDNRVRFDHDLAADWARFQRLKEDADEVAKWAHYAENPLWHAALRLLGQHLLRRSIGVVNGWDAAFARAEALGDTVPPLAADLLLDALFLDPTADARLEQRVEMLFENSGARLLRLLVRFEHVGTEPSISGAAEGPLRDFGLYLDAHFRTPVIGRWPAVARFLERHKERAAALASPIVARVCARWLTSVPVRLSSGEPMPLRLGLAELALATARTLQLSLAKRDIWLGDGQEKFMRRRSRPRPTCRRTSLPGRLKWPGVARCALISPWLSMRTAGRKRKSIANVLKPTPRTASASSGSRTFPPKSLREESSHPGRSVLAGISTSTIRVSFFGRQRFMC